MQENFTSLKCGFLLIAVLLAHITTGQTGESRLSDMSGDSLKIIEAKEGFYLVTGVFPKLENTQRHVRQIEKKGYPAAYAYWNEKEMYFTYTTYSSAFHEVKAEFTKLRKEEGFSKVWILEIGNSTAASLQASDNKADETQAVKVVSVETTDEPVQEVVPDDVVQVREKTVPVSATETHNTYELVINVKDKNNRTLPANVKILNSEENKVLATIRSSQEASFRISKKENQNIKLVCEEFGYHKTIIGLPLGDPAALSEMENVQMDGQQINIDFPLENAHKGDVMIMFNVFFQPNSNIMRAKSKDELETLLGLLKDNPGLKIRIHGHTNGNGGGPIVKINESCDNFFDPKDVENTRGSAIKLSEYRADAIKLYLIKNGIGAERIEIKGWGGKKMLFKKDSPHYKLNARVEVEVMDI